MTTPSPPLDVKGGKGIEDVSVEPDDAAEKSKSDFPGLYPLSHTERISRLLVSLVNPFITWLTVILLTGIGVVLFGQCPSALLLPAVYLLATYAWPHSRTYFSEPLALLFLLLVFWWGLKASLCYKIKKDLPLACALGMGICSGLAVLARNDSAVALPGLAVLVIPGVIASFQRQSYWQPLRFILVGAGCFFVVAAFQLILNNWHFGGWLASGYSDQPEGIQFSIPFLKSLWIYLLSPGKGIFWYSPPLIITLFLWKRFLKENKAIAIPVLLVIAGYMLVIGRWQNLGGWCWGPRHLFQVTPFLLLPIPLVIEWVRDNLARTFFVVITLLLGVFVQVMGVLVDFMWPLDQWLRGLPAGEDTRRVLSLEFYGPLLHMRAWRLDPYPDLFLVDLWNAGGWLPQGLVLASFIVFLVVSVFLVRTLRVCKRKGLFTQ